MRIHHVRQRAGTALVAFAMERSLERREMERSITAAAGSGGSALATLAVVEWFERAMFWVGWRLHPQHLTLT